MGLDINTPKGQATLKYEQRAYEKYLAVHPNHVIHTTAKDGPAIVDGMITDLNNNIIGIIEQKSRFEPVEKFKEWGSILLSYNKMAKAQQVSKHLQVPFFVLMLSVPDDEIYLWQVTDSKGAFNFEMTVDRRKLPASINGGTSWDNVVYLPFSEDYHV